MIYGVAEMSRLVYERTETRVDKQTGEEVETSSSKVVRLPSEPAFVKLYIDDLSAVLQIPEGPKSLIWLLVRHMSFDGVVAVTAGTRRRLSAELGIKETTFRNYLSKLTQSDVLKRIERGEYEFNPSYFAKGDWATIYQRRRSWAKLEVRYSPDGRREVIGQVLDQEPSREEQLDLIDNK